MATDPLSTLQDILRERGIRTMRTGGSPAGYTGLSMSTYSVQEFLNAIAPGPIDGSDNLEVRIIGRPSDLGVGDDPWRFEAVPSVADGLTRSGSGMRHATAPPTGEPGGYAFPEEWVAP